jgi:transmembrane sensor
MTRKETSKFNLQHAYQLFQNYFSGNATDKEREIVETWNVPKEQKSKFSKSKIEKDRVFVYNKLAERFEFKGSPYLDHPSFSLKTIHRQIAVAASILLIVGLGIYAIKSGSNLPFLAHDVVRANTIFQTTDAQTRQITLPDGSRIHLNRGTKISYASNAFNRRLREVWLSGEAFFEVAKNPDKPFIIHTGDMITTVRGTSFNVKAYPQLGENVVSVKTGKVEVKAQDKVLAMLTPDKQLEYNKKTNASQLMNIDADEAISWQNGGLTLNYADKDELKLRIKQYYNADIQFRNNALDNIKIKSTFADGTSLTDVLGTIEALYGVRCSTQNNQIIIDKQ